MNIKWELQQRANAGHESVMQSLRVQQEALAEKVHIMSVMRVSELLYQLVDNKHVANIGAQYAQLHYWTSDGDNALEMGFYFKNKNNETLYLFNPFSESKQLQAYQKAYLIVNELEKNKLDSQYFAPDHSKEFEISKKGIENFTVSLLNERLRELLRASQEALLLDEKTSIPSALKNNQTTHYKL